MKNYAHSLLIVISVLVSYCSFATTYTFSGTGDWTTTARWANGLIPPSNTADSIVINGTCTRYGDLWFSGVLTVKNGSTLTVDNNPGFPDGIWFMSGKLRIEAGGTMKCWAWIYTRGKMEIDGTLWLSSVVNQNSTGAPAVINGTIECGGPGQLVEFLGPTTINNGGVIHVRTGCHFKHQVLTVNPGGILNNEGSIYGYGNLIINTFANPGILSPGNSPGTLTITGDYTPTSSASHIIEIGGTATTDFDQINISGNVILNGTLTATLYNGYTPSGNFTLPFITGSNITGTFSSVSIPSGFSLVYGANSVSLQYGSVLPVLFINVEVKKGDGFQLLTWNVTDEQNVSRYEIEKSPDGRSFKKIGTVDAMGRTAYQFKDVAPSEKSFYRIKSVDRDGKSSYSAIVVFNNGNTSVSLRIFPVPANNAINIEHPTALADNIITISSVSGQQTLTIRAKEKSQQTKIDISSLANGPYFLKYNNGGIVTKALRFVKL